MLSRHLLNAHTLPFTSALSLLPPSTHEKHTRYHFPTDRSLSLGSALLQRTLLCRHYSHLTLTTAEPTIDPDSGRPSFAAAATAPLRKNQVRLSDYNTSHHNPREAAAGEPALVTLAAVSAGRVGVDVVPTRHRAGGEAAFLDSFGEEAEVFTRLELEAVRSAGGVREQVRCLLLLWGLKEAWVKAVGTGIVGDLRRVEFRGVQLGWEKQGKRWTGAEVWVHGKREAGWWMEVEFVESKVDPGEGWFVVVCCEQDKLGEGAWREGEWEWVDYERDIAPWAVDGGGEDTEA
ncbi:hypothetical protein EDC01DRAFT_173185 [Geopyxis carbonaria]|nr:hypothetical protein EDC01DRAFT_173185 [Geopyxis carbonaria]